MCETDKDVLSLLPTVYHILFLIACRSIYNHNYINLKKGTLYACFFSIDDSTDLLVVMQYNYLLNKNYIAKQAAVVPT